EVRLTRLWHVGRHIQQGVVFVIKRARQYARFDLSQAHPSTKIFQTVIHRQCRGCKQPRTSVLFHRARERLGDVEWRAVPDPADGTTRLNPADAVRVNRTDLRQYRGQFAGAPPQRGHRVTAVSDRLQLLLQGLQLRVKRAVSLRSDIVDHI